MEPVHDFISKLRHPSNATHIKTYLAWRRAVAAARLKGERPPEPPEIGPISINLDLTTACNFRCDHCIDWDVLNLKVRHRDLELRSSIENMCARGLRSVILIGGGEPTLYPGFVEFVEFLKSHKLQVAIVSNGSRADRLKQAACFMGKGDWIRLSLDSGSNQLFREMHKPNNKRLDLDSICDAVPAIRACAPEVRIGFSFIIVWKGATRDHVALHENIHEIGLAARRAKAAGFHYISYKAVLERGANGAEVMDPRGAQRTLDDVLRTVRAGLEEARALEDESFAVLESTNIRSLGEGNWQALKRQPKTCHMQLLRQVLTPLGLYNCPAHRGLERAKIAGKDAYSSVEQCQATAKATSDMLDQFDASEECAEVTCIYNAANWWIEDAIVRDIEIEELGGEPAAMDHFL